MHVGESIGAGVTRREQSHGMGRSTRPALQDFHRCYRWLCVALSCLSAGVATPVSHLPAAMVKKHIAPGGFPFAENAILEGLEGGEYMRRTIEEIQQSTAKMRAKRESSMAHEIAKIRMRQDAVAARRGPPPRPQYPRYEPFSGVRKQPGGAHLDTEYEALLAQLPNTTARNHGWHKVPRLAPPTGQLARPARSGSSSCAAVPQLDAA